MGDTIAVADGADVALGQDAGGSRRPGVGRLSRIPRPSQAERAGRARHLQKAMSRIRDVLRKTTRRTFLSQEALISELNPYIRGAGAYFRLAEPRTLWNLDRFVLARIARWARHKRVRRLPVWSLARGGPLYREHGLATWWRKRQPT